MTTEPDAALMTRYCDEVLYPMLTEGCGVDATLAAAISADVLSRAWSFVALPDSVRNVLLAPFVEEVFDHDPPEGTLQLKASVTVVVRNSMLEDAHANGPLNAGGIRAITTAACAPLSQLLAASRRGHVYPDTDNMFAHLPTTYPRAWAALTALADTFSVGGRGAYRVPDAPTPDLPEPEELIDAPSAASDERISVLSAIDPRFGGDQDGFELVDGLSSRLESGGLGQLEHAQHLHRTLPTLGQRTGLPVQHGASSGRDGRDIDDEVLAHIWPTHHENVHCYGTHSVDTSTANSPNSTPTATDRSGCRRRPSPPAGSVSFATATGNAP